MMQMQPCASDASTSVTMARFRMCLFVALFAVLAVEGLFSYDNRLAGLGLGDPGSGSTQRYLQASWLVIIFLALLAGVGLRFPNPIKIPLLKFYTYYLLACVPSLIVTQYFMLSVAAWGVVFLEFLILVLITAPVFDLRIGIDKRTAYAYSLYRICWGFIELFILLILVAHLTAPAFQLGDHLIKTDRFAGGTWFYWAPNLITEFAAVSAAVRIKLITLNRRFSIKNYFFALAAIVVLLLSHSRSSILALAVMFFFLFYYGKRSALKRLNSFLILILVVVGIIYFRDFAIEYVARGQSFEQAASATGRLETYVVAIQVAVSSLKSILFGSGFYVGGRLVVPEILGRLTLTTIDQTFLEVLVNCGVFALVPFTIFVAKIYRNMRPLLESVNIEHLFVFCLSVALFFRALTGPTLHEFGFHIIFAVLMSMAAVTKSCGFETSPPLRSQ